MSDQHPCAKLGKEGESNFKTKDRLGDNEWCKPDDLSARAVRSHSHTQPLFSFFSSPLSFSTSGPIDLLKLRNNSSFWTKVFLLHLIMD